MDIENSRKSISRLFFFFRSIMLRGAGRTFWKSCRTNFYQKASCSTTVDYINMKRSSVERLAKLPEVVTNIQYI